MSGPTVVMGTRASRRAAILGLASVALLATVPAWGSAGMMRFLVEVLTLLALAQMWNLLAGYAGLVSIGQQAFIGLGAYGLFVLTDLALLPAVLPVVGVGLLGAAVSLAVSPLVFRLAGGYFAIGTWVVAEVIRLVVLNTPQVGGGTGVTVQALVAMPAAERQALTYWLALMVGIGSIVVVALIMRSRLGLALSGLRDSEVAARSLGVDIFRAKLFIFLIAGVGCAVAGAVIYMQLLRIQPNAAFGIDWTARMMFVVIIGGVGRIEGPIVGVAAFFLLQQTLAELGTLYLVILGGVAIFVTLLAPGGLWGLITSRYPVALFGIQRRLLLGPARPIEATPANPGGSP
ncbi:MAG TPA: branched-chain amino acid ABC transporter permease [Candidatus Limnocylindria bacterium]|nr:branched-chain amino acid ABC transporter permease [Candidatus Limnocylindria bacterium]